MSKEWISYSAERPPGEGDFEWRMPSRVLAGLVVVVAAKMRERNAGYQREVSPSFDYWDGWQLLVPDGLQWRDIGHDQKPLDAYETRVIGIEGLEFSECLYCGKVPKLKGVRRDSHGTSVGAKPCDLNRWWLECCSWGCTPHLEDPREIERIRREAKERAQRPSTTTPGREG